MKFLINFTDNGVKKAKVYEEPTQWEAICNLQVEYPFAFYQTISEWDVEYCEPLNCT
jgi:hypothetical protein